MIIVEILKSVANGDLHTTKDIYPLTLKNPQDTPRQHNRKEIWAFEKYHALMECIGNKEITGDKEIVGDITHYINLRLTQRGKDNLRYMTLTLKDIDNTYGKDSLKVWLLRPLATGILTALIVGLISFIAGVCFSDRVRMFLAPPENIQQQNKEEGNTKNPTFGNDKSTNHNAY